MHRQTVLNLFPKRSFGAEIGVFDGRSAQQMLEVVNPTKLYLVDPWEYYHYKTYGIRYKDMDFGGRGTSQKFQDALYTKVVKQFIKYNDQHKNTVKVCRCSSVEFAAELASNSLDWVYIDGSHLFETVLADLFGLCRVVKPGGFIAGHDYNNPGSWEDGVTVAVNKFLESGLCEVIDLGSGIEYLLRKK